MIICVSQTDFENETTTNFIDLDKVDSNSNEDIQQYAQAVKEALKRNDKKLEYDGDFLLARYVGDNFCIVNPAFVNPPCFVDDHVRLYEKV